MPEMHLRDQIHITEKISPQKHYSEKRFIVKQVVPQKILLGIKHI